MQYLALSVPDRNPLVVVEASSIEQANSRVKGALHSLGKVSSQYFECVEFEPGTNLPGVPKMREEFFELMGYL